MNRRRVTPGRRRAVRRRFPTTAVWWTIIVVWAVVAIAGLGSTPSGGF